MSRPRNWTLTGGDFTVLHEDGRFRLYGINDKTESFIAHGCSKDSGDIDNWWTHDGRACPRCQESASDELVALWILHNWDRLQKVKPWPLTPKDPPI